MQQYNKRFLYYNIFISFFISLSTTFFIFVQVFFSEEAIDVTFNQTALLIFIGIYIVIEVVLLIFFVLQYKYISYEITDDLIKLKKGIIFKKEINLKYEKMHAIDTKQNIIQKLFKITKLSIDSGSTTRANLAEIVIVEDEVKIQAIQNEIKARIKAQSLKVNLNDEEVFEKEAVLYKYENKEKLMFVFMSSLTAFVVGMLLFLFGSIFILAFSSDQALLLSILIAAVSIFGGSLIITPIMTFLYVLIRYYNYVVIAKSDHFSISHGLITKVNHVLHYNKIKGIRVEEGLIKRIFKYATVKLEVVGFGQISSEENKNQAYNYLIPLCKKKDVEAIIESLKLDFKYIPRSIKSPTRAFKFFISLPMLIYSGIYLAILPLLLKIPVDFTMFLSGYLACYFLVMLLILINGILYYKNSGIYYDDNQTILYFGSYTKISLILLNKNITEIELIDTYCRKKKAIASYNIHYFNNAIKNEAKVHLLENDFGEDLKSKIRY